MLQHRAGAASDVDAGPSCSQGRRAMREPFVEMPRSAAARWYAASRTASARTPRASRSVRASAARSRSACSYRTTGRPKVPEHPITEPGHPMEANPHRRHQVAGTVDGHVNHTVVDVAPARPVARLAGLIRGTTRPATRTGPPPMLVAARSAPGMGHVDPRMDRSPVLATEQPLDIRVTQSCPQDLSARDHARLLGDDAIDLVHALMLPSVAGRIQPQPGGCGYRLVWWIEFTR